MALVAAIRESREPMGDHSVKTLILASLWFFRIASTSEAPRRQLLQVGEKIRTNLVLSAAALKAAMNSFPS